ncbi:MAG: phosphomannomutase/phosphoglucomutase [Patescibacteria group bacterium]
MGYTKGVLAEAYQAAFKSADIRGVYPTEINEELAYRTARAFVTHYKYKKVLVARDMRHSSPSLHEAFVAGVRAQGADAVDLGLVATPAMYFASGKYKLPGVMITASHNPKQYNGLKLVEPQGVPLTDKTGLKEIEKLVVANEFKPVKKKGKLQILPILGDYKTYLKSFGVFDSIRPLSVVVDAGNGMGSVVAPILTDALPVDCTPLFFELDGSFPNRGSNPTLAKNQRPIIKEIKSRKADIGIAFDGDADRVAFFDERGRYVNSAVIGALIADHLLKVYPKETYIYTNFTSRAYQEAIEAGGGRAVRARIGHAFIKRLMREKDARFACEHSAHFYFKSNYYTDSGIITVLRVLEILAAGVRAGDTFSDLVKPFNRYFQTEEILVPVKNKKTAIAAVQAAFKAKPIKTDTFDGLFMSYKDVWFTVKQSVTEDALKFVVESASKKRAQEVQKKIHTILKKQQ